MDPNPKMFPIFSDRDRSGLSALMSWNHQHDGLGSKATTHPVNTKHNRLCKRIIKHCLLNNLCLPTSCSFCRLCCVISSLCRHNIDSTHFYTIYKEIMVAGKLVLIATHANTGTKSLFQLNILVKIRVHDWFCVRNQRPAKASNLIVSWQPWHMSCCVLSW